MPPEQQIAEAIAKVLRRREFGRGDAGLVQDETVNSVWRAFFAVLENLGVLGSLVMVLVVAALIALVVWLFYTERRYRLGHHEKKGPHGHPASDSPLAYAEALALKQDWAGALLALYAWHLHTLHQQGWVVLDESRTGLQYGWELYGRGYNDIQGFENFRKVFNRVRYGGYTELRDTYEAFLAYCRQGPGRRRIA
jgi:hypothetical protein